MPIQIQQPRTPSIRRSRAGIRNHDGRSSAEIPTLGLHPSLESDVKGNPIQVSGADTKVQGHRIQQILNTQIGSQKFDMWFGHTILEVHGHALNVRTESQFAADWIISHFTNELRRTASEILGPKAEVSIVVSAPNASAASVDEAGAQCETGELAAEETAHGKTNADKRKNRTDLRNLDDFVVGASNRLAFAAACRVVEENDSRTISPLFIHGECGLGKTHLLQGICQRVIERTGRRQHVRYVNGEQFTNEYITAIRNNTVDAFRAKIRKLDLLAIDDVHFLSNKVRTQTEFLYTLDAIDLGGARVVLASDNHPRHIKRFNQSLVSRFLAGMVVKIEQPDRAMRQELLRRMAQARGMRLNDAAVEMIADNCLGSVRELEGAITKLGAYKSLVDVSGTSAPRTPNPNAIKISASRSTPSGHTPSEIGLVLAEQLFREQPWQPTQTIRLGALVEVICARLAVAKADVIGSGRHRRVVLARGLIAYLGRELTTHSFPEIAQALGRNNHSTIHTADQRVRKIVAENGTVDLGGGEPPLEIRNLVDQLRRAVKERHRQAA